MKHSCLGDDIRSAGSSRSPPGVTNIGAFNRLLRDYCPGSTQLGAFPFDLLPVKDELNRSLRPVLGYRQPAECLTLQASPNWQPLQ
jgi:hypothetical protein